VSALLIAEEGKGVYGDPVILTLRCKSGRVQAYITWNSYLGSDDPTITYRFGTEPALTNYWGLSTDSTATFYRGPLNELDADYVPFHDAFVKKLITIDRSVAQVTPYNENPITAVFGLIGIEHAGQQVLDACS
jgi:type VI secretion system protein VasI